jgi:thiamine biosynthesis lipoprotein
MTQHVTRRRAIAIFAGSAAALAAGPCGEAGADWEWHGTAMGADAQILLSGARAAAARRAIEMAVAEIERVERSLSLFRNDSQICRINRQGVLAAPSADLTRALALALSVATATEGLFDPTVQALWEAHVDWFTADASAGLPPDDVLAAARAAVGWRRVSLEAGHIRLGAGQRITLNGLGQGYVTDRVADILRGSGFDHVLVDLGEQRALGPRADGTPWLVARRGTDPLRLRAGALATSEGAGCVLGAGGAAHHLFDPRTGRSANHWRTITVHHRSAAVADALSTALYVASTREIDAILARLPGLAVWATAPDGGERRWGPIFV